MSTCPYAQISIDPYGPDPYIPISLNPYIHISMHISIYPCSHISMYPYIRISIYPYSRISVRGTNSKAKDKSLRSLKHVFIGLNGSKLTMRVPIWCKRKVISTQEVVSRSARWGPWISLFSGFPRSGQNGSQNVPDGTPTAPNGRPVIPKVCQKAPMVRRLAPRLRKVKLRLEIANQAETWNTALNDSKLTTRVPIWCKSEVISTQEVVSRSAPGGPEFHWFQASQGPG